MSKGYKTSAESVSNTIIALNIFVLIPVALYYKKSHLFWDIFDDFHQLIISKIELRNIISVFGKDTNL